MVDLNKHVANLRYALLMQPIYWRSFTRISCGKDWERSRFILQNGALLVCLYIQEGWGFGIWPHLIKCYWGSAFGVLVRSMILKEGAGGYCCCEDSMVSQRGLDFTAAMILMVLVSGRQLEQDGIIPLDLRALVQVMVEKLDFGRMCGSPTEDQHLCILLFQLALNKEAMVSDCLEWRHRVVL